MNSLDIKYHITYFTYVLDFVAFIHIHVHCAIVHFPTSRQTGFISKWLKRHRATEIIKKKYTETSTTKRVPDMLNNTIWCHNTFSPGILLQVQRLLKCFRFSLVKKCKMHENECMWKMKTANRFFSLLIFLKGGKQTFQRNIEIIQMENGNEICTLQVIASLKMVFNIEIIAGKSITFSSWVI